MGIHLKGIFFWPLSSHSNSLSHTDGIFRVSYQVRIEWQANLVVLALRVVCEPLKHTSSLISPLTTYHYICSLVRHIWTYLIYYAHTSKDAKLFNRSIHYIDELKDLCRLV